MSGAGFLVSPEPWMNKAECKGQPLELFILEKGYSAREAQKYCRRCPVRQDCLEYAIRTQSVGVWGGHVFTFKTDAIEIQPIRPLSDFRLTPVGEHERVRMPSILGRQVVSFVKKVPSVLGTSSQGLTNQSK